MSDQEKLRALVIDWLDDNYHFGDTESLLDGDDEKSLMQSEILDSLGFVNLVLFLENSCSVEIDRASLSPENFDAIGKIVRFVTPLPNFSLENIAVVDA